MSQRRPTEAEIRDARRLLGVAPGATRVVILKAWRDAVRRNHPDAAPEPDRTRAEALCSRINAAKDMLLLFPAAPQRPAPPHPRATVQAPRPARVSSRDDDYIPTGVAAGGPIAPPRTGLLLMFLVVGFLALLSILAMTTRDEEAAQGSRIGGAPTGSEAAPNSDVASATTPAEAMAVLMAAAAGRPGGLGGVTSPATRLADVDDIVTRIAAADPGSREQARSTTRCEAFQPGISDRASCTVGAPEDLLPHPVEMRRVDDSWRVLGYLPGR